MIFSQTLDLVLSGQKTQVRRLKRPHQHLYHFGTIGFVEGEIPEGRRIIYQVGRRYAVQPGPRQKGVALIRITAIRDQRVISISEADAHAEGFASREHFFAAWRRRHGVKADLQQWVWVLTFELYKEKAIEP